VARRRDGEHNFHHVAWRECAFNHPRRVHWFLLAEFIGAEAAQWSTSLSTEKRWTLFSAERERDMRSVALFARRLAVCAAPAAFGHLFGEDANEKKEEQKASHWAADGLEDGQTTGH